VGYGKTEVALRAAFKIVQDGKQVALLAPTTVLAQQHYNTFYNRLLIFPTKIEVLSRFQTHASQQKIIAGLKEGKIDIVIGTHRLLQKDISFKNLGLLIIDEEHRFGVKQKEYIKELKKNIDILMMSATPIPRTLSSALSGFRDLSIIETPPLGRLPIETSIAPYDEEIIKKIISAELSRDGQVFYVYNEVAKMQTKIAELKKLFPDTKIAMLNGQMHSKDIESIMWKFTNREFDVLLASTIIESGLDIPTVNTMIIEDAQNFGLSQLYQLRGRVGRQKKRAYCYLLYKDDGLTQEAIKRLEAMKEFAQLGSGFKLAMKDLEIRGAGAILSKTQHGFVRDIGYDMFSNLLKQEGEKIKGYEPDTAGDQSCEINLTLNALIPETFIEDQDIRIMFYRKLADAKTPEEVATVSAELKDRFGKLPQETQILFEVVDLRLSAQKLSLERISEDAKFIYFHFCDKADFSNADIPKLIKDYAQSIEFIHSKTTGFKLKKDLLTHPNPEPETIVLTQTLPFLKEFLKQLKFYLKR
jgi:transcription-repair coupling factor (superfamily II helicase)